MNKCVFCNKELLPEVLFCQSCGNPVKNSQGVAPVAQVYAEYVEPSSAFAEGLPSWSIEPPTVVVRRRVKI